MKLLFFALLPASAGLLADDQMVYFETKVRPLLAEHCLECHGGEKTKGGLTLDTKQGWQTGGHSGPAIVPGRPEMSLLIKAISHVDKELSMPPEKKGGKLPDEAIATLTEWVRMGAPDPRTAEEKIAGMKAEEAKTWWAFQPLPLADPSKNIDSFIEQKLGEANLPSAPRADPPTLARRITYGLTGLPPNAAEIERFAADSGTCPQAAVADLVERLLASPQYGVHWGRHWLDVVRYADTAGENTDRPLVHAWRYRNWVFDAFNRDLRYDDFVRQQIAGDLLAAKADLTRSREGIIATGYLAIARRFGHDIDKDMHLTHEDVIDTLGKSFLALSIACARCHDHKYDPVTAQDYYALYGIFASTRFPFPGCEPKGQPRDMVPLIPPVEVEALMKPWREKSAELKATRQKQAEMAKGTGATLATLGGKASRVLTTTEVVEGASVPFQQNLCVRRGEVVQLSVAPNASHGADSTLLECTISESSGGAKRSWSVASLVPDLMRGNPHAAGDGAAWCFLDVTSTPTFLTDQRQSINGNSALKAWSLGSEPSVFVNTADQQVMVWTTLAAESFFVHPGVKRPVAVAWISPLDGEVVLSGRVADVHPMPNGDGVTFQITHITAPEFGPALVKLGEMTKPVDKPNPMPVIPVAYAVAEDKGQNVRLHQRGDPEKPGDEVPRRWLSIFGGDKVSADSASGREQLGDWIAHSPLAARVMVNRIWEWHFGRGLARSSNDFGARGERPTHPALLDWLAAKFVESGFSVKAMHRLILSSAAYQRASMPARPEDPDNRLLAHFTRRRLTAEEIYDSVLSASGQLDLTSAEAHPFPPEETWKFTQHNPFNAVYETQKRSAFLMVQRQRRHPFLSLFDGADPNASTSARQTTTVPTQALYFINDPFFHAQARSLATQLMQLPDDTARVTQAWRVLFQRQPAAGEAQRIRSFLSAYPAPEAEKWAACVRVLMAGNEFMHVD